MVSLPLRPSSPKSTPKTCSCTDPVIPYPSRRWRKAISSARSPSARSSNTSWRNRSQRGAGQQQRVFTLIALPRVPLPLVPHAFGVIIDAPVTEEMGIEPAVSLFLITEALQYELQVRFRQVHRLFLHGGRWVAPKLED